LIKNSFLPFLNRTSTQLKGSVFAGNDMLESQLNVDNLEHPPLPQLPLDLQPFGTPSILFEQVAQPICFYIL
jgi:hypothetical protein